MPQAQFLNVPNIGDALGQFISGGLEGYGEKREDDAIQNVLNSVSENSSEQDVLKAILGAKGVSFDKRKSIADLEQKAFQRASEKTEKKLKKEEDIAKEERQFQRQKEIEELKASLKPEKKSKFDETVESKYAQEFVNSGEELARINAGMLNIQELENIGKDIQGLTGNLKLGKKAEFDSRAAAALEPIIKIYNPAGVISQPKLEWIDKNFKPSSSDTRWTTKGKIDGLRALYQNQAKRYQERMNLIQQYNGQPPPGVIESHDAETVRMNDDIIGYKESEEEIIPPELEKVDGSKIKDAVKGPDGRRYKWKDGKWVRV